MLNTDFDFHYDRLKEDILLFSEGKRTIPEFIAHLEELKVVCDYYDFPISRILEDKFVDSDYRENKGGTLLKFAMEADSLEHVKLLIEYAGDRIPYGDSFFRQAIDSKNPDIFDAIVKVNRNNLNPISHSHLIYAAEAGDIEMFRHVASCKPDFAAHKRSYKVPQGPDLNLIGVMVIAVELGKASESYFREIVEEVNHQAAGKASIDLKGFSAKNPEKWYFKNRDAIYSTLMAAGGKPNTLLEYAKHKDDKDLGRRALLEFEANPVRGNAKVSPNSYSWSSILDFYEPYTDLKDVISEFVDYVLLPALYAEAGFTKESDLKKFDRGTDTLCRKLQTLAEIILFPELKDVDALRKGFFEDDFRPWSVSRTWHNPNIHFPDSLRKELAPREWYSFLAEITDQEPVKKEWVDKETGLVVSCLTTSDALIEEHDRMKHCVDGYSKACCRKGGKRSHIISIRDPNPPHASLTTAEIVFTPRDSQKREGIRTGHIRGTKYDYVVIQHRGKGNKSPARDAPDAHKAFNNFLKALENNKLPLNLQRLGETDASKERTTEGAAVVRSRIGYTPNWGHIQKCFEEYAKDIRKGSYKEDEQGYAVPCRPRQDLISGTLRANECEGGEEQPNAGRMVSYRELHVRDWLRQATITEGSKLKGTKREVPLLDKMHHIIKTQFYNKGKIPEGLNVEAKLAEWESEKDAKPKLPSSWIEADEAAIAEQRKAYASEKRSSAFVKW